MSTSHTPGPWTVNTDPRYEGGKPAMVWGPKGAGYGAVCELPPYYPREFNAADAHLIAAAPDLLAACELIVAAHDENDYGTGLALLHEATEAARAAILQAKGGAN